MNKSILIHIPLIRPICTFHKTSKLPKEMQANQPPRLEDSPPRLD